MNRLSIEARARIVSCLVEGNSIRASVTNGFSKKVEQHENALAPYFMYYNFARIHQTLRVPPAMEAGITDHVWTINDIIELLSPKTDGSLCQTK